MIRREEAIEFVLRGYFQSDLFLADEAESRGLDDLVADLDAVLSARESVPTDQEIETALAASRVRPHASEWTRMCAALTAFLSVRAGQ